MINDGSLFIYIFGRGFNGTDISGFKINYFCKYSLKSTGKIIEIVHSVYFTDQVIKCRFYFII